MCGKKGGGAINPSGEIKESKRENFFLRMEGGKSLPPLFGVEVGLYHRKEKGTA